MIEITEARLRQILATAWDDGFAEGFTYSDHRLSNAEVVLKRERRDRDIIKHMRDAWDLAPEDY